MANENRKNQNPNRSKPDQRNGMQDPARDEQQGGNTRVNRDLDNKDRGKLGEQEGMDRQQQSGRGENPMPEANKGELGTEIDDEEDDLQDEDVDVDQDRITQRNPAQRNRGNETP
jgi:hypothetical protein